MVNQISPLKSRKNAPTSFQELQRCNYVHNHYMGVSINFGVPLFIIHFWLGYSTIKHHFLGVATWLWKPPHVQKKINVTLKDICTCGTKIWCRGCLLLWMANGECGAPKRWFIKAMNTLGYFRYIYYKPIVNKVINQLCYLGGLTL